MAARGWPQADQWAAQAADVAPTWSVSHGSAEVRRRVDGFQKSMEKNGHEQRLDCRSGSSSEIPPGSCGRPEEMVQFIVKQATSSRTSRDWRFVGDKMMRYGQVGNAPRPLSAMPWGVCSGSSGEYVRTPDQNTSE